MIALERFDETRQRQALWALAQDTGFLRTPEGELLLDQLRRFFAPAVAGAARRMGYSLEESEVVSGAIVLLCDQEAKVARYAAAATQEPWAYLSACLTDWARRQWGHRASDLDAAEHVPTPSQEVPTGLTPIDELVELTYRVLAPLTPAEILNDMRPLLSWLALNPPQRLSYEGEDRQAALAECVSMSLNQVIAVMNVAWGARPRRAETSLLGAFMLNRRFEPFASLVHARALVNYKMLMRTGTRKAQTLSDWRAA